jgi:hypothetical protein
MPEEYDNDLLKEGILHFKAKEFALARRYFERALYAADDLQTQAQANYYLSQVEDDPQLKRQFLEETLAVDMGHAGARCITVERIFRDIHHEHGHVIDLHYSSSAISITSYRLILLPVWLMHYSFEDQVNRVLSNGQTGTVLGGIPRLGLKDRLENLLGA